MWARSTSANRLIIVPGSVSSVSALSGSDSSSVVSGEVMIARSSTFSSSRMFPGQSYAISVSSHQRWNHVDTAMVFLRQTGHQVLRERRNVALPVTKRRHRDGKHVQTVEQIPPKPADLDLVDQIPVGRRNHPHVDSDLARRTKSFELPGLQDA